MPNWKKLIVSGSDASLKNLQLPRTTTNTGTPTNQGVISFGGDYTNSNRIFQDASGNTLRIQGSNNIDIYSPNYRVNNSNGTLIQAGDGGVSLWYQNQDKFATTATGVDIKGNISASGAIQTDTNLIAKTNATVEQKLLIGTGGGYYISGSGTNFIINAGEEDLNTYVNHFWGSANVVTRFIENGLSVQGGSLGVGITAPSTAGRIEASNDIVAFASSDKRWKENINPISNPISKIQKIGGYTFDWKPLSAEERKIYHSNKPIVTGKQMLQYH